MCEVYETVPDGSGRLDVVMGQSIVLSAINTEVFYYNNMNQLRSYHNKIDWINFVWMQDFWVLWRTDSISRQKTMENNFTQRVVVNTLFPEKKKHHNRKDVSKETPKLGPYWNLQQVTCMVNIVLRSELSLWAETILTRGSEFLMDLTNLWWIWTTTTQKFLKISSKVKRYNWMPKDLVNRSKAKAKPQR